MSYTTVHMRHTSSGSSSSRDAKDVFISGCRNDFDFSQITPEKISKLSKENQNYFHKCDDAINNKLSVDSLVYYSSFILPIICILIFIRIGKKHYRIAEEKIKNAIRSMVHLKFNLNFNSLAKDDHLNLSAAKILRKAIQ
ncbi:hypothetical protein [Acinetobacter baumannii]|uniref:hypothetical protein n=1 Tax=Acinetobacter baumannii TaxID=470 RepID=UPI001D1768DD